MQIEEHNNLIKLFDIYGNLLSNKQQGVMDKYLNLDIAESELAELRGESRQSVHDAIIKAKKQLFEFESKCNILKTNESIKSKLISVLQSNEISLNAKSILEELINKF